MNFDHHPDPAIDFCLEVEAIENDITDRNAGLEPQIPDLGARIERAMQFKVGGDAAAIVAKNALRTIEAAFKAGRADGVAPAAPLAYYDTTGDRVVTAAQMHSMLNHQGAPGKTAAKDYTVPLVALGVAAPGLPQWMATPEAFAERLRNAGWRLGDDGDGLRKVWDALRAANGVPAAPVPRCPACNGAG